jgi:hypothetical protein
MLAIDKRVAREAKRARAEKSAMGEGGGRHRGGSSAASSPSVEAALLAGRGGSRSSAGSFGAGSASEEKVQAMVARGLEAVERRMQARFDRLEQLMLGTSANGATNGATNERKIAYTSSIIGSNTGSIGRGEGSHNGQGSESVASSVGSGSGHSVRAPNVPNVPRISRRHSDSSVSGVDDDAISSFRTTVRDFYEKYNPDKIDTVDKVIQQ